MQTDAAGESQPPLGVDFITSDSATCSHTHTDTRTYTDKRSSILHVQPRERVRVRCANKLLTHACAPLNESPPSRTGAYEPTHDMTRVSLLPLPRRQDAWTKHTDAQPWYTRPPPTGKDAGRQTRPRRRRKAQRWKTEDPPPPPPYVVRYLQDPMGVGVRILAYEVPPGREAEDDVCAAIKAVGAVLQRLDPAHNAHISSDIEVAPNSTCASQHKLGSVDAQDVRPVVDGHGYTRGGPLEVPDFDNEAVQPHVTEAAGEEAKLRRFYVVGDLHATDKGSKDLDDAFSVLQRYPPFLLFVFRKNSYSCFFLSTPGVSASVIP
eukprot:GHVU01102011.1.p1 GENE.GHVU01102011.1~~GHVU01102011.1.p1  ORF type:complete len:321 (-),score=31.18 GHVU01102011.1:443-1405(-)